MKRLFFFVCAIMNVMACNNIPPGSFKLDGLIDGADNQKDEPLKRGAGSRKKSKVKRLLLDTHYQLKKEYLQYYLNEFCYKFNRRYFGEKLFDWLVMVAVLYPTDFKSRVYNRSLCG